MQNQDTSYQATAPLSAVTTTSGEVVKLQHPINVDGMNIEQVSLRRPRVRDRLIAEKTAGSDIEKEICLIANLTDMAPQHVEMFDLADYQTLQECLAGFLS